MPVLKGLVKQGVVTFIAPVEPFATGIKIFDWLNFTLIALLHSKMVIDRLAECLINVSFTSPYSSTSCLIASLKCSLIA